MTETPTAPADVRLDRYLAATGLAERGATALALTGDASDRRYFRIAAPGDPSRIAAVHAGPIDFAALPFTIVSRLLEAMPVRAPRIYDHDDALGIVVLEDLGDVTLQAQLPGVSAAERTDLYRRAIDIIVTLQRRGDELRNPALLPYQLAFDVEKLMWELRFFVTHFLEAHRRANISDDARQVLEAEFLSIAQELSDERRVLCHRDYHSRNLMVHGGELCVIDFQDARLGPDTYDLVSLVRDAYVEFTSAQVDELVDYFRTRIGTSESAEAFRRRFDLMAVQRTLKALGTFGFQATSRGNATYLESVPRTLGVVRATAASSPRFARLHRTLADLVPELA